MFELEQIVMDVLLDTKAHNPKPLHPWEIAQKIGLPSYEPLYGDNPYSIIWGTLDRLMAQGHIIKTENGAQLTIKPK